MVDDLFDFSDADLSEIKDDDKNAYIRNSEKGIKLISEILPSPYNKTFGRYDNHRVIGNIKKILDKRIWRTQKYVATDIKKSEILIEKLMSQLEESRKIELLRGKSIVGMGGKFSAGKSGFINSMLNKTENISLLKEDQNPTTSIPTYITWGKCQKINAYCGAQTFPMDIEAMQAITYEFYRKYKIGFSRYINSIAIHTNTFPQKFKDKLVFLDTPGYNNAKEDETSNLTDREIAMNQLKVADFIIWLIDSGTGTVTKDDLDFIYDLGSDVPILFVFTKADKLMDKEMVNIVTEAEKTLKDANINVYGVTAYSSYYKTEYLERNLVDDFLNTAAKNDNRKNDLDTIIDQFVFDLFQKLLSSRQDFFEQRKQISQLIRGTDEIDAIRLLSRRYSAVCAMLKSVNDNIKEFYSLVMDLKQDLLNVQMYSNCVKIQKILLDQTKNQAT